MEDFEGKVAFITGAASGMGLGIAKVFCEAGMKVVIADVRQEHLDEARGAFPENSAVHFIQLDVTDRKAMAAAADETEAVFGRVHVLINNAGIGVIGLIETSTYDDWDWMLDVNLTGVFNGIAEFLPRIRSHGEGGHVVSTASSGGLFAANKGGPYSTAKYGVVAMMECLRDDLKDENVGVSVLCPSAVRTQLHKTLDLRPPKYADSGYAPGEVIAGQSPEEAEAMRAAMASFAMDPLEVGNIVLEKMRKNQFWILTHDIARFVAARREALLASFPHEPINEQRLAADLRIRQISLKKV